MRKPHAKAAVGVLACLALLAPAVHAERADRDKPINLEADTMEVNDATKVSVYQGNVRLTQGTLQILADKLVVKQDADGFSTGTAYGNPASFRQKRDGVDEYIEGWAQRIEYDGKRDKLELFTNARVKRGQDEVRGSYISYDGRTEFFQVKGGKEAATDVSPKGRVRAVIQPKPKSPPPAPSGEGIRLRPSDSTGQP
jgi:lipopolysaccharide export system protein LptA